MSTRQKPTELLQFSGDTQGAEVNFDFEKVFPHDPTIYGGSQVVGTGAALILFTMALEPLMRVVASRVEAGTTTWTAPGAPFNGVAFVIVIFLYIASTKR